MNVPNRSRLIDPAPLLPHRFPLGRISEAFDTPVMLRVTTRISHSKSPGGR